MPAPIFIGGPDRCGKTLLAAILGSHPSISIPIVGSNMWTFFHGQFGDLADDSALDRCITAMLNYKHVAFLRPDGDQIRRDARARPRGYAQLFALFQEHHAKRAGKPRWGDQTGLIERYADAVLGAYPDAVIIHMTRDPRDRYEASLALWPKGRGRVGGATGRWSYSMRLAERNQVRHRGRYLVVRYEDLVSDPEGTVRRVCRFVGEEYDPQMLQMHDAPTFVDKLAAGQDLPVDRSSLITSDHIGLHRGRVPPREIAFMEALLGARMRRLGYELDGPRLSGRSRLRFWLMDSPLNLARMSVWLGLEWAQHRFPRLVGRSPIRAKVLS